MERAIFLDKDGTLVENVPFNIDPDRLVLTPGVTRALRALQKVGYRVIVVTNQPGVAHGYFSEDDVRELGRGLRLRLADQGVHLSGFYYCPHHPAGRIQKYRSICHCRKPLPGLLYQATLDLNIRLRHSWMIGDILDDVEAGRRAGCRSILYSLGNETEWVLSPLRTPDYIIEDFAELEHLVERAEAGQVQPNVKLEQVMINKRR